jgi:hypothetical protein
MIEQVQGVVTSSSSATSLGTVGTTASGSLNRLDRIQYGSNRWSTSAIRQYLNKSGNDWFASAENFDIRPDQYAKKGFMTGFDEDFLNVLKPVKVTTALNTVEGYSAASEDTYDTFFLSSLQQMNITPQLADVEGSVFPYWRERLDLEGYASTYPTVYDAFKIPAINNASPQYVRLRSASRGYAYATWLVNSAGSVYYYGHASPALRFSPVCVIC